MYNQFKLKEKFWHFLPSPTVASDNTLIEIPTHLG